MKYSYYPGCTLKTKAKELNDYAIASAKALGIEMEEIEDWQCCGGVYSTATDEIANKLSSVRALAQARDKGQDLLTLCSACHNVIKRVNNDMRNNEDFRTRANNYMAPDMEYNGEANVIHYLEMLRDVVGFDNLKKAVVNPLKGKKIAAYYGCLLLRPGKVMEFDDPENPKIMEDFIKAIGATPVIFSQRNECCGGYMTLNDKELAQKRSNAVVASALEQQADCMITACPLCRYNLVANATENQIPVYYFTELLAEALGVKGVNPRKCMKCGKCSATCPAFDAMDYHPHQFVDMVENGRIEALMQSKSIWNCLSCMACVQRCPRSVEPGKLVEAIRLAVIRQQGMNHLSEEAIPELLDPELPQQAIVSAFRKYKR